jgi:Holliday junction resolvase-like predicted endonuclease
LSIRRHNAKRDSNEPAIVDALERLGCQVKRIDTPVDLLVLHRGVVHLVEVKTRKGRLTGDQSAFVDSWPVTVLRSVGDAILFEAVQSKLARQRVAA